MSESQKVFTDKVHYVITGGAGFLGSHLIAALQCNGDFTPCIVLDPSPPRRFNTINFDTNYVKYIQGSFLNKDILDDILPNTTTVFHLCAIGHTGRFGARKYQKFVHDFNVEGTKTLVEKSKKFGVCRFIYSSSIAVVFTGKPLYLCDETMSYPQNDEFLDIYSKTKAEAERFVRSASCSSFKTTCLRFRAIYGPQDVTVSEKVVKMVQRKLFMVKISKHPDESISQMSSGKNCGQAFHLANQALAKKNVPHGQVYFITDDKIIGQYEVWKPLIEALGEQPPAQCLSYKLASLPPMTRFELEVLATTNTFSIEKAKRELEYSPGKNHFDEVVDYYRIKDLPIRTAYLDFGTTFLVILLTIWVILTYCNSI